MQWAPGKKSIFNIDDEYDEADMNAPDIEEDMMEDQTTAKKPSLADRAQPCFIGQGNNPSLPKDSLTNLGYRILARGMLFSNEYRMKWVQTSMEVNYMHFKEGTHLANHISNANKVFTNKIATLQVIEQLQLSLQNGQIKSDLYSKVGQFFPETYRLDIVSDLYQFLNSTTQGLWLEKKSQSNQGRGIKLIEDISKYREELLIKKDVDQYGSNALPIDSTELLIQKLDKELKLEITAAGTTELEEEQKEELVLESTAAETTDLEEEQKVSQHQPSEFSVPKKITNLNNLVKKLGGLCVQKYLEKPQLINKRKYDIRFFMLIACTKPYLVLTNSGYVRISLEDYNTDSFG